MQQGPSNPRADGADDAIVPIMVKQAAGWFMQPQRDAASEREPHRIWVYRSVFGAILDGRLPPAARLPSARQFAAEWGVTRGVVDEAFAQLQSEGLIERRIGDGSYVCASLPPDLRGPATPMIREPSANTRKAIERIAPLLAPVQRNDLRERALRACMPDVSRFPLATWRRCVARSMAADSDRSMLTFGEPAGLPMLREATARYAALTLSLRCRPEQVLIVNSAVQALDLITRVLLEPGDVVAIEDPCHVSLTRALFLAHLDVVGVPIDASGFDVDAARARAPKAAAIYLHPTNQYPTGVFTSASRRAELLRWADECGAWVIEIDYMNEFVHDAPALAPLQRMDRSDRVIYVGMFGGVAFPSLRLGYMVLPERLMGVFALVRGLFGDHSAVANQTALAAFISQGHASAHLRAMRRLYRARRDAFVAAAARLLPAFARLGPTAGAFNASLHLPPRLPDMVVVDRLAQRGVAADPLSLQTWQVLGYNGLALGYGAYSERDIEAAMAEIGAVLRELEAEAAPYQPTGENR